MCEQAIPPSDDESDEEVFQTLLRGTNITQVPNSRYHAPISNADYSQLTSQLSPSQGKYTVFYFYKLLHVSK